MFLRGTRRPICCSYSELGYLSVFWKQLLQSCRRLQKKRSYRKSGFRKKKIRKYYHLLQPLNQTSLLFIASQLICAITDIYKLNIFFLKPDLCHFLLHYPAQNLPKPYLWHSDANVFLCAVMCWFCLCRLVPIVIRGGFLETHRKSHVTSLAAATS